MGIVIAVVLAQDMPGERVPMNSPAGSAIQAAMGLGCLLPVVMGIVEIVAAWKMRNLSKSAVMTAAVLVGLQLLGIVIVFVWWIAEIGLGERAGGGIGLVVLLIQGAALGVVMYFLIRLLREIRAADIR